MNLLKIIPRNPETDVYQWWNSFIIRYRCDSSLKQTKYDNILLANLMCIELS